ncbi:MAG: helix-turn-helix domain-containing protein [Anaerolineae bacterium]|nr:helix-turn-helix domain-containing protein [Anaerolineae bacterium]MDW8097959.1 helix-turn-helix domain-containing protein [Anaerolineae bacterium]
MAIHVRGLREHEQKRLWEWAQHHNNVNMWKRAHIILLSAQGYTVPQISLQVGLHPINVRKWIHRFNRYGLSGLQSGKSPGRPPRFTDEQKQTIIQLAQVSPSRLGLPFSRWSLQRLREYLIRSGVVDTISAETIRQILRSTEDGRRAPKDLQVTPEGDRVQSVPVGLDGASSPIQPIPQQLEASYA